MRLLLQLPFREGVLSRQRRGVLRGVLRNVAKFTEKHLCQSLFFNKVEFWDIFKNIFSYRTPPVAASEISSKMSGDKKCLFFRKFGVLCFLVPIIIRFAFLPYYRRNIRHFQIWILKISISIKRSNPIAMYLDSSKSLLKALSFLKYL